jgi:hypothetical protein
MSLPPTWPPSRVLTNPSSIWARSGTNQQFRASSQRFDRTLFDFYACHECRFAKSESGPFFFMNTTPSERNDVNTLLPKRYLTSFAPLALVTVLATPTLFLASGCEEYVPPSASGGATTSGGAAASGGGTASGGAGVSGGAVNAGGSGDVCTSTGPVTIKAAEANNMQFQSTMSLPALSVQPGFGDALIDWSGVTMDMFGRPLDQTKLTAVLVVMYTGITLDGLADAINVDSEVTAPLYAYVPTNGGTVTSAKLSEFNTPGNTPLGGEGQFQDALVEGSGSVFTVLLQNGPLADGGTPNPGTDVLMLQGFEFKTGGGTTIPVTNTSTTLDWTANIEAGAVTSIPPSRSDITINWGSMSTRSFGGTFVTNAITEVMVGRYDASVNLNQEFASIREVAKELYRLKAVLPEGGISPDWGSDGVSVELSKLKTEGGQPFTGIDPTTTDQYAIALVCGPEVPCRNPTPWYFTRLKACGATP